MQQGQSAVITVLGIDGLFSVKLDTGKSEQDRFFGYLQWTREALQEFTFLIVLWVSESILVSLAVNFLNGRLQQELAGWSILVYAR